MIGFAERVSRLPRMDVLSPWRRLAACLSPDPDELLGDALLIAVEAGRSDLQGSDAAWFRGVLRKRSLMQARGSQRYRQRLARLPRPRHDHQDASCMEEVLLWLAAFPRHVRQVAGLVLAGHDRASIAELLGLSPGALRQRLSLLRRCLADWSDDQRVAALAYFRHQRQRRARAIGRWSPGLAASSASGLAVEDPDGHGLLLRSAC